MTAAYKFLAAGAIGPLSRVPWPRPVGDAPGAWLVADGPLVVGRCGAHVCLADQLAHWLHEELWVVEIDGDQLPALDCVVVARARLVRRIDAWSAGGATRFAAACVAHARDLAARAPADPPAAPEARAFAGLCEDADDALREGYPAVAAYCAARAVAGLATTDREGGYARERAWQSAWIARELIGVDRA